MVKTSHCFLLLIGAPLLVWFSVFGSDRQQNKLSGGNQAVFHTEKYSLNRDIAFTSVWGGRPDAEKLKGFEHAVLYNARGEVVQKITIGRDSVYSLDRMIQENKTRGPLFVRMYRHRR